MAAAVSVEEITPEVDSNAVLPGAQFADAYRVAVADAGLDARKAAEKLFARGPRWLLGRVYLAAILPFHRMISRVMLQRIFGAD